MAAERLSLREFQAQLAERLRSAAAGGVASKLGFTAGGRHWLVDLTEINGVVSAPEITPLPWARPWFLGLANIRGMVYGCTDLAAFLGLAPNHGTTALLLVHPRFGVPAALAVEQVLGLRQPGELQDTQTAGDQPWIAGAWHDHQGTMWQALSMQRLVSAPEFLEAGA